MAEKPVPSVGRVVHYHAYGIPAGENERPAGLARAAIITEVSEPTNPESAVALCVFTPSGQFFNQRVLFGVGQPGHWSWPPYVPPVKVE